MANSGNGDRKSVTAGSFIVLEGTDGSGKTTQFQLLADRLRQAGHQVATFDFPQYAQPSSFFVKQYLNGEYGTVDDVGPYTASLFYALDRYDIGRQIRQAIAEGKVVLSNRFSGSSMAHQGTKFANAEQRRGFFIWLDNLEFETLKIPRPDLNIVLRVPAEIAQQQVDKKEKREYTDKKRDIHEADLEHLKRAVEVYDDMCQLFPKDFTRIDCVRNGVMLDRDDISKLVREKVLPLLPTLPSNAKPTTAETAAEAPAPAQESQPQPITIAAFDPEAVDRLMTYPYVFQDVSLLAASAIQSSRLVRSLDNSRDFRYDRKNNRGNYSYITPPGLDKAAKLDYRQAMDGIIDRYAVIMRRLLGYVREQSHVPANERNDSWHDATRLEASAAARLVLPVASSTTVGIFAPQGTIQKLAVQLNAEDLPEVQKAAHRLLDAIAKDNPALTDQTDSKDYLAGTRRAVNSLASKHLTAYHPDTANQPATMTGIWPRNELDIVADMLYEHSSLPLQQLRQETDSWNYNQKADVFVAYLGQRQNREQLPGKAVAQLRYSWELVSDFTVYSTLKRLNLIDGISRQALTPRHGYDMPRLVEDAGADELFEECFDMSLQLFSNLQQRGLEMEAQYATLLGHKLHWKAVCNGREAFRLLELPAGNPAVQQFINQMYSKLAEAHPLLASSIISSQK